METEAIAEVLGGRKILGKTIRRPDDLAQLTRRLSQRCPLTCAESDRTVRMARVYAQAVETIGDREKAVEWLSAPNRALGGERPLDQLDTDAGAQMVEEILGRIAYGVYS
ncbi:MAG: DUF2384 domain-containing protein [Acidobacteria bacterium]|nr:DUF2384 domain-containing protein [Acidobacteriota bacterium]